MVVGNQPPRDVETMSIVHVSERVADNPPLLDDPEDSSHERGPEIGCGSSAKRLSPFDMVEDGSRPIGEAVRDRDSLAKLPERVHEELLEGGRDIPLPENSVGRESRESKGPEEADEISNSVARERWLDRSLS